MDPELELIEVFRRTANGSLPRVAELSREAGETLMTPLLPGFSLPLDELFAGA